MEVSLLQALNEGDLTLTRLLLENGADPNYILEEEGVAGVASMHMAAGLGTDALKLLLEFDGDPNIRSVEGVTPLHIAATWGELDSVKLLLFNGGDPDLKDQEGLRPVDVAKQYNHGEVVCFLQYHSLLLIPEDDMEPRFTRESFESIQANISENSTPDVLNVSFVEDSSPDESLATCARRSSVYTNTLQRKLAGCIRDGKHVCMDVTSPRRPCIEVKAIQDPPRYGGYHGNSDLDRIPCSNQNFRCHHDQSLKHRACRDLFSGSTRQQRSVERCQNCDCDGCESCEHFAVRQKGHKDRSHACSLFHHGDVSYTDSDPDCWEGGWGDEVRGRLRDFHKSFVSNSRRGNLDSSQRYHQKHCESCENSFSCDYFHHSRGSLSCHHRDHHRDCAHRSQRNLLSRSCDHDTFYHGYDSDEESYPLTVKKMPKKISSDPSHISPQWTKLKDKQETSAEKVSRWQSSLNHSPNRFFPLLQDHKYRDSSPTGPSQERTPERRPSDKPAPRRSSMYTSNIQRQLEQHLHEGRQICLDVTSPGHPYIDFKPEVEISPNVAPSAARKVQNVKSADVCSPDKRGKRLSTVSSVSASSCDTFITCDDDTEFTLVTPLDPTLNSNINTNSSSSSDDVILKVKAICSDNTGKNDTDGNKLGIRCNIAGVDDSKVKLVVTEPSYKRQINSTDLRQRSPRKYDQHPSHPSVDHELDLSDVKTFINGQSVKQGNLPSKNLTDGSKYRKNTVQTDIRSFSPFKQKWQPPLPDTDLNVSDLVTSDDSFIERTARKQTSVVQNVSNIRNKGRQMANQEWLPPSIQEVLEDTDLMTSDESFQIRESQKKQKENEKISSLVERLGRVSVNNKKNSPVKTNGKKRVSLESMYSNLSMKEYLYKDKEKGITLLERYVPSDCEEGSTRESLDSTCSTLSINSEDTEIYDWQDYQSETDDGEKQTSQRITRSGAESDKKAAIPKHLSQLSNEEIRKKLQSLGDDPGPVLTTTRQTYLVRLATIEADPTKANRIKLTVNGPEYSPELCAALHGNLDFDGMDDLESKMAASFHNAQGRCWREGTQKSSFNYLLLDPRVTKNLPCRAKTLSQSETFKAFIHAIFYVGKGKRARPYCHLYEAISHMQKPKPKVSKKVQHILDIWQEGLGVVSLHIFQSVIPVEAYTREACMVEAVGLSKLTNMKRGDFYGVASTWPVSTKRKVGVHLLTKALKIFLSEGERQICPVDIKS